jgi:hypothetical protein
MPLSESQENPSRSGSIRGGPVILRGWWLMPRGPGAVSAGVPGMTPWIIRSVQRGNGICNFTVRANQFRPSTYARHPDGNALVGEAERPSRSSALQMSHNLIHAGKPLLGSVLNNRNDHVPSWISCWLRVE